MLCFFFYTVGAEALDPTDSARLLETQLTWNIKVAPVSRRIDWSVSTVSTGQQPAERKERKLEILLVWDGEITEFDLYIYKETRGHQRGNRF